jgi:hypothetical protein
MLDDREDGYSGTRKITGTKVIHGELDNRQDHRQQGIRHGHDLLPPSYYEEEEGGASARSAGAPLATPLPPGAPFVDLFDPVPGDSLGAVEPGDGTGGSAPPDPDVEWIAQTIVRRVRGDLTLDLGHLAPALAGAKARTGWSDDALAMNCVNKLKRIKPRSPTGFLVTDLCQLNGDVIPSPRMELANRLDGLMPSQERAVAMGLPAHLRPLSILFSMTTPYEWLDDRNPNIDLPDAWDLKDAEVVEWVDLLAQVDAKATLHLHEHIKGTG